MSSLNKNKTVWINGPTPPFDKFYKLLITLDKNKQMLLIYGYIRLCEKNTKLSMIPNEIKQLVFIWFYCANLIMNRINAFAVLHQCIEIKTNKQYFVSIVNKNPFYRIPSTYRSRHLRAMYDELEILSYTCHPNIVQIHCVYEDAKTIYIVMEECVGGNLFDHIVERGHFTEYDAAKITKQLLSALQYMHEENQIVHCGLNANNIFFSDKSDDLLIKIIGFGYSRICPRLGYLKHLCDTPYYTSPEMIKYKKYNHACDVWSVGVILYIMIFGYPPIFVDPEKYGQPERKVIYAKIKRGFIARVRSTAKYGFGPWFPDHIPVSLELRHFMSKLLEYKVRNRYTAHEALQHPWIMNAVKNDSQEMMRSLMKFNMTCKFKSVVIELFRQQFEQMRPKHFKQLQDSFTKMDTNGGSVISYQQFENAVSNVKELNIGKKYIQQLLQNVNVDLEQISIGINFVDLLHGLVHDYLVDCDERLYVAFRELDEDNDGKIIIQQLKEKLKKYDRLDEWDRAIDIITQQTLTLDTNGVIDYEEFLLNLHPNFEDIDTSSNPNIFRSMFKTTTENLKLKKTIGRKKKGKKRKYKNTDKT